MTPRQILDAIRRALDKSAQYAAREQLVRNLIEAEESGFGDRTVREIMADARARAGRSAGSSET